MKTKQEKEKLYKLWFDTKSSELLEGWPLRDRDENYYVNKFYEEIIFDLPVPEIGKILVLGTHNCISFDKLCKHFGYDRCVGFDLFNPNNHPCVVTRDCDDLTEEDNFEIAFCHNDMGGFWKTPQLKLHCQNWAAKNIIKGGYFLGNNNYNRPRFKLEKIMSDYGFKNYQLNDSKHFNSPKITISDNILKGYMLSIKVKE